MNNVTPIQAASDKMVEKPQLTEQEAVAQAVAWSKAEGIDIGSDLTKQLLVENKARELLGVPLVEADANWRDRLPADPPPGLLENAEGLTAIYMVRKPGSTAIFISDSSGCQGANVLLDSHRVAWLIQTRFGELAEMAGELLAQQIQAQQPEPEAQPAGLVGPDGNPLQ